LFEKLCDSCDHKNCCTDSAVPLVFSKDLLKIKTTNPDVDYLKTVTINGISVNAIKKKEGTTECIFWNGTSGGCTIYASRPMDCKLYPFDILYVGDSYYWIVYSCNEKSDWTWTESHLISLENDDGFDDLMNNLDLFSTHTQMTLPVESKKTPYTVLRKVSWTPHHG